MQIDAGSQDTRQYDYDLYVIGGGSGGLAASKEAAELGAKVGLADFVKPSPQGTTWGLGGTCVNVGCIPKKMMHYAAILGEIQGDQRKAGWAVGEEVKHDWTTMQKNVGMHVKSINWGYKMQLKSKQVEYHNAFATFVDEHTLELTEKNGNKKTVTADKIIIAVGGRPNIPDIPGKEHCITSDDIFWIKNNPGKTLVVGASYVALECAGFLAAFGNDTTVMVRSILLRGFDQDMAEKIGTYMEAHHTKFIRGAVPHKVEKGADGKLTVFWKNAEGQEQSE